MAIVTDEPYVQGPPEDDELEDELDEDDELDEEELEPPKARRLGRYTVLPSVTILVPEVGVASYLSISPGDS